MKPLYLIYSNGLQPYHHMAEEFCRQVSKLKAGNCIHLCLSEPETEKNFNVAIYSKIFAEAEKVIADRPVIILDSDHVLRKPIIEVFDGNWDIGAVYRNRSVDEFGRHDYCSGLVLLNNRRPDCAIKFCHDWLDSMSMRPSSPGFCPKELKQQGWTDTWFDDQTSLNEIIAIDDEVKQGIIYTTNNYRVLPLKAGEYSRKGIFIKHFKGKRKSK